MSKPGIRRNTGATLPFVVFALAVTFAMLAITVDLMREFYCLSILQNTAQSASLHALRRAYNDDGELKSGQPETNIAQGLNEVNGATGAAWFSAPAGPNADGGGGQTPVLFEGSDMTVNNADSADNAGDLLVTLKARRDGTDALKMKFIPLIYGFGNLFGQQMPSGIDTANPYRVAEVCLQPATRIGAGSDNSALIRSTFSNPHLCTSFPIALSNVQWQTAAQPTQTRSIYTIRLAGSKRGNSTTTAGEISAAFINLTASGDSDFYNNATGGLAVNELYNNLAVFSNESPSADSAAVERDSRVYAFDADSQEFIAKAKQISDRITKASSNLAGRFLILPLIDQNPVVGQKNRVIGFARMRLNKISFDTTTNNISIQMEIGQSRPMANASVGTQLASVPSTNGTAIGSSSGTDLFTPRSFTSLNSGSLTTIARGMVMAPALSPRSIAGGGI